MSNLKITDNSPKLDLTAIGNWQDGPVKKKTFRGDNTKIDINTFDGYELRQLHFTGVCYTREDALRLSDFFKVHAYCLKEEKQRPYKA